MDYRKRLQTIYAQAESEDRKKGEGIYYEEHHKIPAHYFANEQHPDGRNNPAANLPENKVLLTGKEHYMSHRLLYKIDPCPANLSALVMMQRIKRDGKIYTVKGREAAAQKEAVATISSENMSKLWDRPGFRENQSQLRTERNYEPEFNKASSDRMKDRHHNCPQWQEDHRKRSSKKMTKNHQTPDFIERRDTRGSENMTKLWQDSGFVEDRRRVGSKQMHENWTKDWFIQQHSVRVKKQRNDPILDAPRKAGLDKYNKSPKGIAQKIETARKINGDYVFERPMSANSPISQERYSIAPSVYKWWLSVNHLPRGSGRTAAANFFGYEPAVAWQKMIDNFRENGDALFNNAKWRERFENNPQFANAQQAAAKLVEDL